MKEKIKNLLLIIWVLISLKIIWLTGVFVLKVFLAFLLKALHISDMFSYKYIWKYFPATPINEDDYGAVSLLTGYLHVLLFFFVISSWVLYFSLKTVSQYKITKQESFIMFLLLAIYMWFLLDVISIVYDTNNILNELKKTYFLLMLQILISCILIINIISVINIFNIKRGSTFKKLLLSSIVLAGGLIPCTFVAFVIIWSNGALALALKSASFETRTIEEIIHAIYNIYGLNISWCTTEKTQPCKELYESVHTACASREFISQVPIGGKRLGTNLIGQMSPVIADLKDGCSEFRGWYDLCMQEEARAEFIKRWKKFNSIAAEAKPHFEPIDTWSKYTKK